MTNGAEQTTWGEAAILLGALIVSGFLASWVITDRLHWPRRVYIAVLAILTSAAAVTVAAVTGLSGRDLVTRHWLAGVLVALLAGSLTGLGLRRKEGAAVPPSPSEFRAAAPWEGVLYGLAEGVLLSVLPVSVVWQAAADAGWSGIPAGLVALSASATMIAVHHFGYWDYRGRSVGVVIAGCGVFSLGYLLTGSLLAAALGHVLMHLIGVAGGVQLPPHLRPSGRQAYPSPA